MCASTRSNRRLRPTSSPSSVSHKLLSLIWRTGRRKGQRALLSILGALRPLYPFRGEVFTLRPRLRFVAYPKRCTWNSSRWVCESYSWNLEELEAMYALLPVSFHHLEPASCGVRSGLAFVLFHCISSRSSIYRYAYADGTSSCTLDMIFAHFSVVNQLRAPVSPSRIFTLQGVHRPHPRTYSHLPNSRCNGYQRLCPIRRPSLITTSFRFVETRIEECEVVTAMVFEYRK
jgi:hypothetical protein